MEVNSEVNLWACGTPAELEPYRSDPEYQYHYDRILEGATAAFDDEPTAELFTKFFTKTDETLSRFLQLPLTEQAQAIKDNPDDAALVAALNGRTLAQAQTVPAVLNLSGLLSIVQVNQRLKQVILAGARPGTDPIPLIRDLGQLPSANQPVLRWLKNGIAGLVCQAAGGPNPQTFLSGKVATEPTARTWYMHGWLGQRSLAADLKAFGHNYKLMKAAGIRLSPILDHFKKTGNLQAATQLSRVMSLKVTWVSVDGQLVEGKRHERNLRNLTTFGQVVSWAALHKVSDRAPLSARALALLTVADVEAVRDFTLVPRTPLEMLIVAASKKKDPKAHLYAHAHKYPEIADDYLSQPRTEHTKSGLLNDIHTLTGEKAPKSWKEIVQAVRAIDHPFVTERLHAISLSNAEGYRRAAALGDAMEWPDLARYQLGGGLDLTDELVANLDREAQNLEAVAKSLVPAGEFRLLHALFERAQPDWAIGRMKSLLGSHGEKFKPTSLTPVEAALVLDVGIKRLLGLVDYDQLDESHKERWIVLGSGNLQVRGERALELKSPSEALTPLVKELLDRHRPLAIEVAAVAGIDFKILTETKLEKLIRTEADVETLLTEFRIQYETVYAKYCDLPLTEESAADLGAVIYNLDKELINLLRAADRSSPLIDGGLELIDSEVPNRIAWALSHFESTVECQMHRVECQLLIHCHISPNWVRDTLLSLFPHRCGTDRFIKGGLVARLGCSVSSLPDTPTVVEGIGWALDEMALVEPRVAPRVAPGRLTWQDRRTAVVETIDETLASYLEHPDHLDEAVAYLVGLPRGTNPNQVVAVVEALLAAMTERGEAELVNRLSLLTAILTPIQEGREHRCGLMLGKLVSDLIVKQRTDAALLVALTTVLGSDNTTPYFRMRVVVSTLEALHKAHNHKKLVQFYRDTYAYLPHEVSAHWLPIVQKAGAKCKTRVLGSTQVWQELSDPANLLPLLQLPNVLCVSDVSPTKLSKKFVAVMGKASTSQLTEIRRALPYSSLLESKSFVNAVEVQARKGKQLQGWSFHLLSITDRLKPEDLRQLDRIASTAHKAGDWELVTLAVGLYGEHLKQYWTLDLGELVREAKGVVAFDVLAYASESQLRKMGAAGLAHLITSLGENIHTFVWEEIHTRGVNNLTKVLYSRVKAKAPVAMLTGVIEAGNSSSIHLHLATVLIKSTDATGAATGYRALFDAYNLGQIPEHTFLIFWQAYLERFEVIGDYDQIWAAGEVEVQAERFTNRLGQQPPNWAPLMADYHRQRVVACIAAMRRGSRTKWATRLNEIFLRPWYNDFYLNCPAGMARAAAAITQALVIHPRDSEVKALAQLVTMLNEHPNIRALITTQVDPSAELRRVAAAQSNFDITRYSPGINEKTPVQEVVDVARAHWTPLTIAGIVERANTLTSNYRVALLQALSAGSPDTRFVWFFTGSLAFEGVDNISELAPDVQVAARAVQDIRIAEVVGVSTADIPHMRRLYVISNSPDLIEPLRNSARAYFSSVSVYAAAWETFQEVTDKPFLRTNKTAYRRLLENLLTRIPLDETRQLCKVVSSKAWQGHSRAYMAALNNCFKRIIDGGKIESGTQILGEVIINQPLPRAYLADLIEAWGAKFFPEESTKIEIATPGGNQPSRAYTFAQLRQFLTY